MKPAPSPKGRQSPELPVAFRGACYLYGIVRASEAKHIKVQRGGVGDPPRPVMPVLHHDIAALASEVDPRQISEEGVRGMRRDMKAHSASLLQIAAETTVLPARFGLVFPGTAALISQFLRPKYTAILENLNRLDGAVEITLRATYIEPQILREVVSSDPSLAGGKAGHGYSARIELGKRIAAAIQDHRDHDGRVLIHRLAPAARDVRLGEFAGDLMVLNASFLLERARVPQFDQVLAAINTESRHRMAFDCIGPLPPYSFVDLHMG